MNHQPRRRTVRRRAIGTLVVAGLVAAPAAALARPACPISYGTAANAKPNQLYLYFPAASDATFPEFGGTAATTAPAAAFNTAQLSGYTGTALALRSMIGDVVANDYCEFNVQVRSTTATPPSTFARRNVVAIGTDSNSSLYGFAQNVDTGDPTSVDYARVWAGSYAGTPELTGSKSTLVRWARSIGGTAAHEAGHNYGLSHESGSDLVAGEDALDRHVMPAGSDVGREARAAYRRHFSDRSFSILASNVGLSVETLHNWDLVNPNQQAAARLRMEFLSTKPSLVTSWFYNGAQNPWTDPTTTKIGTTVFKGQTYNRFRIDWSTPHAWNGATPGVVPGGGEFHVGATFSGVDLNQPESVVIVKTQLLNAGGQPLALQPRLPAYDSGEIDSNNGTFSLTFANFSSPRPLVLRRLEAVQLPRVLSLNDMVRDAPMRDWMGEAINAWPETNRVLFEGERVLEPGAELAIPVARLADGRHIFERVERGSCLRGDSAVGAPDTGSCAGGFNVDLFPATTLYVKATVANPNARHWVPASGRYEIGPVETTTYYQVGGRHPDLNQNRVDDAIDIATGTSRDENQDGVPDEAQRR